MFFTIKNIFRHQILFVNQFQNFLQHILQHNLVLNTVKKYSDCLCKNFLIIPENPFSEVNIKTVVLNNLKYQGQLSSHCALADIKSKLVFYYISMAMKFNPLTMNRKGFSLN